jgi:hypothetical protein
MKSVSSAARKNQRALPWYSSSIWISESQLTRIFHRFIRIQTRHGSHVPGPLEARRRAAKRTNTSLAQGSHSCQLDPSLLFSARPKRDWWQAAPPVLNMSVSVLAMALLVGSRVQSRYRWKIARAISRGECGPFIIDCRPRLRH